MKQINDICAGNELITLSHSCNQFQVAGLINILLQNISGILFIVVKLMRYGVIATPASAKGFNKSMVYRLIQYGFDHCFR